MGDETVLNGESIDTGDLVVAASVLSTDSIRVSQSSVQYFIVMSPEEALGGFIREETFYDGQYLRIDRRNRVTLPDLQIRLEGLGFPKVGGSNEERTALIVTFSLMSPEEVSSENVDQSANLTFTNQVELDTFLGDNQERKRDTAMRSILAFLKDEADQNDDQK
jgi:DnaJ-class molecular chaperone